MDMQARKRKLAPDDAIELAYAAYVAALVARGPREEREDHHGCHAGARPQAASRELQPS